MPLARIRENLNQEFQIDKCKSKGTDCTFCASLNSDHVILDCDLIKAAYNLPGKMSDCIVIEIHKIPHVAIVELKGVSYSISEVCSQLEAGAMLATRILKQSGYRRYKIFPVFVSKKFADSTKARMLKKQRITIGSEKMEILLSRCDKRFSDIVPENH